MYVLLMLIQKFIQYLPFFLFYFFCCLRLNWKLACNSFSTVSKGYPTQTQRKLISTLIFFFIVSKKMSVNILFHCLEVKFVILPSSPLVCLFLQSSSFFYPRTFGAFAAFCYVLKVFVYCKITVRRRNFFRKGLWAFQIVGGQRNDVICIYLL